MGSRSIGMNRERAAGRWVLLAATIMAAWLLPAGGADAATPTLSVTADATAEFGDAPGASVTIVGGQNPTGTIRISLYGPGDTTCSNGPSERTKTVNGPGPYHDAFGVYATGTYRWKVVYSGDANNTAVSTVCGVRQTVVSDAVLSPTSITASATPSVTLGQSISATGKVSGAGDPWQELTFRLYPAGNTTCTGTPVYTNEVFGDDDQPVNSGSYTPLVPGTYRWKVNYEGDPFDNAPSETTCGQAGLSSVVSAEVDPCVANPSLPGCEEPDPCIANPSLPGCEEPDPCVANPSLPGCEEPDPCVANPSLPGCEEPDPCTADPNLPQCQVCPPGASGTYPYCSKPECPPGSTGTIPHCVKNDPCAAVPGSPGCRSGGGEARLAVGAIKPAARAIRRNRSATFRFTVTNQGDADATGVRACPSVTKRAFKVSKKCVELGTIGAGVSKTTSVKVKATGKPKGKARLTVKVSSTRGGGGDASAGLRIKG